MKTYHLTIQNRESELLTKKIIEDLHAYMEGIYAEPRFIFPGNATTTENQNYTYTLTVPSPAAQITFDSNIQVY